MPSPTGNRNRLDACMAGGHRLPGRRALGRRAPSIHHHVPLKTRRQRSGSGGEVLNEGEPPASAHLLFAGVCSRPVGWKCPAGNGISCRAWNRDKRAGSIILGVALQDLGTWRIRYKAIQRKPTTEIKTSAYIVSAHIWPVERTNTADFQPGN